MRFDAQADLSQADARMRALAAAVKDASEPLGQWASYYGQATWDAFTPMTFEALYEGPRPFRGVMWPQIEPQYIRKTGPEADRRVPPWGDVDRIAGAVNWNSSDIATGKKRFKREAEVEGKVRGKLRKSGGRVKRTSMVGRDTNEMVREFARNPVLSPDHKSVTLSTNQPYAPRFNKKRPFAFVTKEDGQKLTAFCLSWLRRKLARG